MRIGRIQNNYSLEGFQLVKDQQLSFVEICCNSEEEALALVAKKEDVKQVIAQTGNFSYTMSGAHTGGFWGFRDLILEEEKAVTRYLMVDSNVVLEEGPVHFGPCISEIWEYTL